MRENNRKPIEKCRRKLPQFTTMNVIDGQAGLVIYSSLIFYSLTIDNILNIIVLIILAGISISMLTGQNGILNRAVEAKEKTQVANEKEAVNMAAMEALTEGKGTITKEILTKTMKSYLGKNDVELTGNGPWQYVGSDGAYTIGASGKVAQGWVYVYDNTQSVTKAPVGVTNGKITLNIGDYINYNPTSSATYKSEVGITQTKTYTTNGPDWSGTTRNWDGYKASDYQAK